MRRSRKLSSESVIRPQKNLVASASDSPASTQRMRTSHRRDPSCDRPAIISARVEGSRAATASHSQPQHGPAGYGCRGRSWDRKILERERRRGISVGSYNHQSNDLPPHPCLRCRQARTEPQGAGEVLDVLRGLELRHAGREHGRKHPDLMMRQISQPGERARGI
jgi:hypothetical protein